MNAKPARLDRLNWRLKGWNRIKNEKVPDRIQEKTCGSIWGRYLKMINRAHVERRGLFRDILERTNRERPRLEYFS